MSSWANLKLKSFEIGLVECHLNYKRLLTVWFEWKGLQTKDVVGEEHFNFISVARFDWKMHQHLLSIPRLQTAYLGIYNMPSDSIWWYFFSSVEFSLAQFQFQIEF